MPPHRQGGRSTSILCLSLHPKVVRAIVITVLCLAAVMIFATSSSSRFHQNAAALKVVEVNRQPNLHHEGHLEGAISSSSAEHIGDHKRKMKIATERRDEIISALSGAVAEIVEGEARMRRGRMIAAQRERIRKLNKLEEDADESMSNENAPPVRACFLSMIRHSRPELMKFHRLLKNVESFLSLMAHRYPFVGFHEHVDETFLARTLLEIEHDSRSGRGKDISEFERKRREKFSFNEDDGKKGKEEFEMPKEQVSFGQLNVALTKYVFPGGVIFYEMDQEDFGQIPPWIAPERGSHKWSYPSSAYWGIPYRHMCRFFAVRLFNTPFFQENNFDYYLRLDTDSYILAPPLPSVAGDNMTTYDLFEAMALRKANYGFSMLHQQHQHEFLRDLWETYDSFLKKENAHLWGNDDDALRKHGGQVQGTSSAPLLGASRNRARHGGEGGFPGVSRGIMLHYWDNFEIFDLTTLRRKDAAHVGKGSPLAVSYSTFDTNEHGVPDAAGAGAVGVEGEKFTGTSGKKKMVGHLHDFEFLPLRPASFYTSALGKLIELQKSRKDEGETHAEQQQEVAVNGTLEPMMTEEETVFSEDSDLIVARGLELWKRLQINEVRRHNDRASAMHRFLEFFDREGGFYYHRWGDAEVRTLFVNTFFTHYTYSSSLSESPYRFTPILYFNSLPYQHYHNFHCPENADEIQAGHLHIELQREGWGEKENDIVEKCRHEARQRYPNGGKGQGTAPMHPAEHQHINNHFWDAVRSCQVVEQGGKVPSFIDGCQWGVA